MFAIHENGGTHLRAVHAAGLPDETRRRICTGSAAAPHLIGEIDRFLRSAAPGSPAAIVAALPIAHGARTFGLLVVGRCDDRPFSGEDQEIELEEQRITVGGRTATLTPCELRILTFLAEQPGRPRSRRESLQHLWHAEHVGDERACDVHISNLRRKVEDDPSRPRYLVTLRGQGYALEAP